MSTWSTTSGSSSLSGSWTALLGCTLCASSGSGSLSSSRTALVGSHSLSGSWPSSKQSS
eukprot:CAMPEP_0117531684 /NCGR_PEP_ID=MMETSP0784-20121206/38985_1 /TAXON_ID=39447 /ORGANISM="" /LENGTH=58 /DNA_ID=CAMNT_0005328065 /DNA_START=755 /DNA_END=931 /DNA_ORIENTATION=-